MFKNLCQKAHLEKYQEGNEGANKISDSFVNQIHP